MSAYSNSITLKSLKGSSNDVANVCTITATTGPQSAPSYTVQSVPTNASTVHSVMYVCGDLEVNGASVPSKIETSATALSTLTSALNDAIDAKVVALGQEYGADEYKDADDMGQEGKLFIAKAATIDANTGLDSKETSAKGDLTSSQGEISTFKSDMDGFFNARDAQMTAIEKKLEYEKSECAKSVKDIMDKIRSDYAARTEALLSQVTSTEGTLETARGEEWHDETDPESHKSKLDAILDAHKITIEGLINALETEMTDHVTGTFTSTTSDTIQASMTALQEDINAIREGMSSDAGGTEETLQSVIEANATVDAEVESNMGILEDNVQTLFAEMAELSSQFHGLLNPNGGSTGFTPFTETYAPHTTA